MNLSDLMLRSTYLYVKHPLAGLLPAALFGCWFALDFCMSRPRWRFSTVMSLLAAILWLGYTAWESYVDRAWGADAIRVDLLVTIPTLWFASVAAIVAPIVVGLVCRIRRSDNSQIIGVAGAVAVALVMFGAYWLTPDGPDLPDGTGGFKFVTDPPNAIIFVDGKPLKDRKGNLLRTPCTVYRLPTGPHDVVFRLAGRPDFPVGQIDFSAEHCVDAGFAPDEPPPEEPVP